jgi:2-iminoacetate synthase
MGKRSVQEWADDVVKNDEIDRYLDNGKDFIDHESIESHLNRNQNPDKIKIRDIIQKSLSIQRLDPDETAALLHVRDKELREEMAAAALEVKRKVYDNRIVIFAPLYCSNVCVNNCLYCGFRKDNTHEKRRVLTPDEVRKEAQALVKMGHKRLIAVYGEHPLSDADYMAETIKAIYEVNEKTRKGTGSIRRVNVNAAPLSIEDFKKLWKAGIGTFQVFQETYHRPTYQKMHPAGPKSDYRWRLYTHHRAMEAGIDDVAIGALFGLYHWRYDVMGLLYHAIDLEEKFDGIGPHTVSFPRLMPADNAPYSEHTEHLVSDDDFKHLVTVLRLSIPYTGMIITARERPELRKEVIKLGCTQTDASTRIGLGAYSEQYDRQEKDRQQFVLGDTRELDDVVRELAELGMISSFCTAGYRCGRTGDKIMGLLKCGTEGKFCKLNAVLTFREWLDDFSSPETQKIGEALIKKEIYEIHKDPFFANNPLLKEFEEYYTRVSGGERDLFL